MEAGPSRAWRSWMTGSWLPNPEGACEGSRGYPPEFRRKVLDLVDAGRPVVDEARDRGISAQSIYT